jgi:hypothetical protein
MSRVKYCRFSISANTALATFRVNVYWGFRKSYIELAEGGEWDVKYMTDRTEEWAAIQSVAGTWLRKTSNEKSFFGATWYGKEVVKEVLATM